MRIVRCVAAKTRGFTYALSVVWCLWGLRPGTA